MQLYIAIVITLMMLATISLNINRKKIWSKEMEDIILWRKAIIDKLDNLKEHWECLKLLDRLNHDDVVYKKWRDDKTYYNRSICNEIDSIIMELANNSWEIAPSTTDKLMDRWAIIKDNIYPNEREW